MTVFSIIGVGLVAFVVMTGALICGAAISAGIYIEIKKAMEAGQ